MPYAPSDLRGPGAAGIGKAVLPGGTDARQREVHLRSSRIDGRAMAGQLVESPIEHLLSLVAPLGVDVPALAPAGVPYRDRVGSALEQGGCSQGIGFLVSSNRRHDRALLTETQRDPCSRGPV